MFGSRRKKQKLSHGDQLSWREVQLPDRLEDAEGFFGLEEIDDVEVVRNADGSSVFLRPTKQSALISSSEVVNEREEEEEWLGFDNDKPDIGHPLLRDVLPVTKQHQKKHKTTNDELENSAVFKILGTMKRGKEADITAWTSLELSTRVLQAISQLGFTTPTPIQEAAIPPILSGHDVIGKAVTGSGKTLAFGIPIVEHCLATKHARKPMALILAPTRELASQLNHHLQDLCQHLEDRLRIVTITGGLSVLKQQRQLENADIVVATPGRLWDVITGSSGLVDKLKAVKYLVIDEADRLLSEGHFKEVEDILDALDRKVVEDEHDQVTEVEDVVQRQTLVFSATFHKGLQQKLAGKKFRKNGGDLLSNKQSMEYLLQKVNFREPKPIFVDSNPINQMASALEESILECDAMQKDLYLYTLILQHATAKILVFTNAISSVRRLVPFLQSLNQPAVALHSEMIQKARLRSIERFSSQRSVLVATDVAARGLDIKGIDLIIHYHVPRTADTYIHRSGRTARAERSGRSIMLCSANEVADVTRLIKQVHSDHSPAIQHIDRAIISRLQARVKMAQKITEVSAAKEKSVSQDEWLRKAAEELGTEYDSEEFAAELAKSGRGRGAGRRKKQREDAAVSKGELAAMRAALKEELERRVSLEL